MRKFSKKQYLAAGAAALVVAGAAGSAFAYWTTSGSGSTTTSTTTGQTGATGNLTFATSQIAGLYPGQAAQAFTTTITDAGTQNVYVTGVSAYVTVSPAQGAPAGTCNSSDYAIDGVASTSATSLQALNWTGVDLLGTNAASGHSASNNGSDTIAFVDKGTNQDACKGATVTINYVSS